MSACPLTYDEGWQWLMDRVGETVYRGPAWPEATSPYLSRPAAIHITDVVHAKYLHDHVIELGVRYFDEPQK